MNTVKKYMWCRYELEQAMIKAGWQPGTKRGLFVHGQTLRHVDIDARGSDGRIIWISHAMAKCTPVPF